VPCPKCGAEIHENYKKFQCQKCDFGLWKIVAARQLEIPEVEELIAKRRVGPLAGFRSKLGKPFAAVIKLTPEFKAEFDFSPETPQGNGAAAQADFTGQDPVGKCPRCGAPVFQTPRQYVCERAAGTPRACDFRAGKVILQQPLEPAQMRKLLDTSKTDLLDKFISKKGRPFKAFLVLKHGDVAFEFESPAASTRRPAPAAGAPKTPAPTLDFTGQQQVGNCPKCAGRVFETETAYLCQKSQADKRPCKFKINKVILQQLLDRAQAARLLAEGRTDLLPRFISKTGRPFPAYLVMDGLGQVTFEFPHLE
jgi:DNA topoisomerase-3